ncbi:MAG: hypothetical protein LBL80_05115 [Ruminococcus sp.]|jgi:hypothetical protein|nr:hypothetical protein [Ruminococcus sp.]
MKKETLIKKAAERGITLTESQAEKYLALSEDELANIAGGANDCTQKTNLPDCFGMVKDHKIEIINEAAAAAYCGLFSPEIKNPSNNFCSNCASSVYKFGSYWCTNSRIVY